MSKITIREALNRAISSEMKVNPNIFIIGEEVAKNGGPHGVTQNMHALYPQRVFDMPISESCFTGLAVGASLIGLIPICDFMTMNFSLQGIDHIINSCAKTRYMSGNTLGGSIVFRGPNGFARGVGAQHTQDFGAWYGSVPGLKVIAPYTAKDHYGLLKNALRDGNPVVFLENEEIYGREFQKEKDVFEDDDFTQEFKCVVEREGTNLTLLGIGISVGLCLEAADILGESVSTEVINLVSIRPLDLTTIIESVRKTRKMIIVDFMWPRFSISSEIACCLYEAFENECVVIKRLNGADCPTPYAENLEKISFPRVSDILKAVNNMTL